MPRSLRARTTVVAALAVGVVMAFSAAVLVVSQRNTLTAGLDEALTAELEGLATSSEASAGLNDAMPAIGVDDDAIAQVVTDDSTVVAGTPNLAGQPALTVPGDVTGEVAIRTTPVLGRDYRVASMRVEDLVLHVGAPLDDVDESVSALKIALTAVVPMVVLVLGGLIWWLTGRMLQPVESIRREVAEISGRNLHRRVPRPNSGDGIEKLALTMNSMLDRLQAASESQERFVADASHELRSPLARIRAELEVDIEHPETADLPATHRSVLEEAERMQQMIDDLLTLARLDQNRAAPSEVVRLDEVVLGEVDNVRATTTACFEVGGVAPASVCGDVAHLKRVVCNLLENATRHARRRITVDLGQVEDRVVLEIGDDGPGIPQAQRERVFERFTRIDDVRNPDDGGTGLGLAIAREIVRAHGGTIGVTGSQHGGATFVVDLPGVDQR